MKFTSGRKKRVNGDEDEYRDDEPGYSEIMRNEYEPVGSVRRR